MAETLIQDGKNYMLASRILDLERQIEAMRTNQAKQLIFSDDSTGRIFIDGLNGAMKISLPGFNVQTATNQQLLFSTTFGTLVESHYSLLAERNFNNNTTTFQYAGPTNSVTLQPDPVLIQVNSDDYKNILFYLEANMSGHGSAICEAQLFCVTNGLSVPGSIIDSPAGSVAALARSSAFNLFSGNNQYAVQYRRVGGTSSDFPDLVEAHLVARTSI